MPKQRTAFPGGELLPLLETEIKVFFASRTENFGMSRRVVRGFVNYAAHPEMFGKQRLAFGKVKFAEHYAEHPDFVLAFLSKLRRLLANPEKRFQIQKFLVTQPDALDSFGKGRFICNLTASEIAGNLSGLAINDDDVRAAESELRKIYLAPQADYFLTGTAQRAIRAEAKESDRKRLLNSRKPKKPSVITNRKTMLSAARKTAADKNAAILLAAVRDAGTP